MNSLILAIAATTGLALLSLVGALFFAVAHRVRSMALFVMVAFAAGAMMAAAFFHLMPEACAELGYFDASVSVFVGFGVFFVLERFLHWHHCHKTHDCEVHPFTTLSLLGDAIHNFLDGIVIGGAFLINPALGWSTTIVIAAHELPQELGDFAILVHGGHSHRKALGLNLLTGLTAILGAILAWFGFSAHQEWVPYLMGFAAGNFIYISASDLIPELHKESNLRKAFVAFLFFVIAAGLMAWLASGHLDGHAHVH
jgi:zinc and cadmium transporter